MKKPEIIWLPNKMQYIFIEKKKKKRLEEQLFKIFYKISGHIALYDSNEV